MNRFNADDILNVIAVISVQTYSLGITTVYFISKLIFFRYIYPRINYMYKRGSLRNGCTETKKIKIKIKDETGT